MMTCGKTHVGRCTGDRPLFTRDQAVARLAELGYAFDEERYDWWRGDDVAPDGHPADRGRLAVIPDYCGASPEVGTRWFLMRPHGRGEAYELTILGGES